MVARGDYRLLIGDCLEMLRTLPEKSVHCCISSPPYFALRDYGVDGQIGLEPTPEVYIDALVQVYREVWRVLRDDGVCWINLGCSYADGTLEPQDYVMRNELSADEKAYVLEELAKWQRDRFLAQTAER